MLAPLASESFTNVATRADADFDLNGGGTQGTVSQITATISFDASNDSYTLTSPSGSITFSPADIDDTQSSAGAVVYVKENGSVTNSLTLTRAGTSGALTYQYVGSAFWQRTVVGTASVDGSIDAFAYGVETPDADVPRTGSANYDLDLIGAITNADSITGLAGTGTATVDFGFGNIIILGTMQFTDPDAPPDTIDFNGEATLSGSANTFTGTFEFNDFQFFQGDLVGKLFGPAAEEFGAAWNAEAVDGRVAGGTLMGRQGAQDSPNTLFNPPGSQTELDNSQTFTLKEVNASFTFDNQLGFNTETGDFGDITGGADTGQVRYDAAIDRYIIVSPGFSGTFDFETGQFINLDGMTSAKYDRFPNLPFQNLEYLRLFFLTVQNGDDFFLANQLFGIDTPVDEIPVTGRAAYEIQIVGKAFDNDFRNPMILTAVSNLFVDFGTGTITAEGGVNYREQAVASDLFAEERIGNFAIDAMLASGASEFAGTVSFTGLGSYSGTTQGGFFGPDVDEIGGVFEAAEAGSTNRLFGSFAGDRDDTIMPPVTGALASLTDVTDLAEISSDSFSAFNQHFDGDIVNIALDPSNGFYTITFQDESLADAPARDIVLGSASRDQTLDTAETIGFSGTVADGTGGSINTWFGWRALHGGGAANIDLTYMSFGNVVVVRNNTSDDYHPYATGLITANAPRTGGATYSGLTTGTARVQDNVGADGFQTYRVDGTVNFDVDFTAQALTGTFSDMQGERYFTTDAATGQANRTFGGFTVGGAITGSTFKGEELQSEWRRFFEGAFFGPDANEAGGTFGAKNDQGADTPEDSIEIDGSFGAVQD